MKSLPLLPAFSLGTRPDLTPVSLSALRPVLTDFLGLSLAVGVFNFLFAPADPGWLGLNPTPWLLVPLLLAVRYGFASGLSAGLLTALLVVIVRTATGSTGIWSVLVDYRFAFLAFPSAGMLVGYLMEMVRKRYQETRERGTRYEQLNRALNAERELLLLSRQDLQLRLGLYGAESASLDEELHELARTCREFAPAQLLATLERLARVRSAAIYRVPAPSDVLPTPLQRVSVVGDPLRFPAALDRNEHRIVREALETGNFLAQKTLWDSPPSRDAGFLAAYSIVGAESGDHYVLILQDVAFADINPRTFSVICSLCDWFKFFTAQPMDAKTGHRAVNQSDFFQAIETAVSTHRKQSVPSLLVRVPFDVPDGIDPLAAFKSLVDVLPRTAILTSSLDEGHRSLLFLLPAESDPETGARLRSAIETFTLQAGVDSVLEPQFHHTRPDESPQQLWGRLVGAY